MTISTTSIIAGPYTGNGVTTTFSYGFLVDTAADVAVYETTTSPGATPVLLAVGTDYTVAGLGSPTGGTITRVAGALPTGYTWYIRSNRGVNQSTAFQSQGGFLPAVHESAFDKLTLLVQQAYDRVSRSLRLDDNDSSTAIAAIPSLANRVSRVLGFDANGDITTYPTTTAIAVDSRAPRGNIGIAVSATDVILTPTQFDNASFDITGTLTANVNIIIPDNYAQHFVVDNATTGAFTLTIKHAATAGVVVTQGNREIMYTTGAVVEPVQQSGGGVPNQPPIQTHLITTSSQVLPANVIAPITGLNATITPSSNTKRIKVSVRWTGESSNYLNYDMVFGLQRNGIAIGNPAAAGSRRVGMAIISQGHWAGDAISTPDSCTYEYIDSPASITALTYSATVINTVASTVFNQRTVSDLLPANYERLTSTIILEEVD